MSRTVTIVGAFCGCPLHCTLWGWRLVRPKMPVCFDKGIEYSNLGRIGLPTEMDSNPNMDHMVSSAPQCSPTSPESLARRWAASGNHVFAAVRLHRSRGLGEEWEELHLHPIYDTPTHPDPTHIRGPHHRKVLSMSVMEGGGTILEKSSQTTFFLPQGAARAGSRKRGGSKYGNCEIISVFFDFWITPKN